MSFNERTESVRNTHLRVYAVWRDRESSLRCSFFDFFKLDTSGSKEFITWTEKLVGLWTTAELIVLSCFEPRHDKTNKITVRPAKTDQSSHLSSRSVSSLSTWRNLESLATHSAQSEESDQTADAQADLSLRWAHMPFRWFCREAALFYACVVLFLMLFFVFIFLSSFVSLVDCIIALVPKIIWLFGSFWTRNVGLHLAH